MAPKNKLEKLRNHLETESIELEKELKAEFAEIKATAKKRVVQTLLVGGGAIAALSLLKLLLSDKKKVPAKVKEGKQLEHHSVFTERIKSAVLAILLELAKKKLIELITQVTDDTGSDKGTTPDK